jgi:hypothetical protein
MSNPTDPPTINLLYGTLGALIGVVITSIITIWLFFKNARIQSNRFFLDKLIVELQKIYISQISHLEIKDEYINAINAFQGVSYKDMSALDKDLNDLKQAILDYNKGREKTLSSTTTSQEEIHAAKMIDKSIKAVMERIRQLT